jgi:Acetyltransferase (GNAT) domain
MTLAHGTDRLEPARLVLRRIAPDDLPFFTRIHALPEVAQHLHPEGQPRSPEETAAWLQTTLASYEHLALGYLALLRKEDGAPPRRRTVTPELIARCGLMDLYAISAILPQNARSRRVAERSGARAPAKWTWSVSRGIATCGRSRPAARLRSSRIHEIEKPVSLSRRPALRLLIGRRLDRLGWPARELAAAAAVAGGNPISTLVCSHARGMCVPPRRGQARREIKRDPRRQT